MKTEHWVEYYFPGLLFSESSTKRLKYRDVDEAVEHFPESAFAFELYDVEVRKGTLEDGASIEDRRTTNKSCRYYPDATTYTVEQVKQLPGDYKILISNMECNKHKRVVRTKAGNWQPFEQGDQILIS